MKVQQPLLTPTNSKNTINLLKNSLKVYSIADKTFSDLLYINISDNKIFIKKASDESIKYTISYEDLFGIEVPIEDDTDGLFFNILSTKFKDVGWFFSKIDNTKRVPDIMEFRIKPKDYVYTELVNARHQIMNNFWSWMQKTYNSGLDLEKEKDSYVHPKGLQPYEAKVMVFVSPVSGKGHGPARWKEGQRFLRARGFHPIVHHTPRRRYTIDTVRELTDDEFKEIFLFIGVGGDGMVHEILNGFKERPDVIANKSKLKMRCASFMGGSACSTVSFMAIRWKLDKFSLYNNIYIITRCRLYISKTMEIETNGEYQLIHSYHTLSSGYIADVVKNSEFLRFLGELRYLILLVTEIFRNKTTSSELYLTSGDVKLPPLDVP